jgi:phosphate acetyltransferase
MHTFFLAPTGFDAGLTSVALGMIRALEQSGLRVGFVKPIAQGRTARQSAPPTLPAPSAT